MKYKVTIKCSNSKDKTIHEYILTDKLEFLYRGRDTISADIYVWNFSNVYTLLAERKVNTENRTDWELVSGDVPAKMITKMKSRVLITEI